ncbi:biliverdin-producing heme oxygenase, partial [Novosphingobium sp. 1949]|nr:biliverdin-producing heme oxygenase [Novosphingobium organovorum]
MSQTQTLEAQPQEASRARRLRDATHDLHQTLDTSIIDRGSFTSLEGYGHFLRMQQAFHRDIAALYADPALGALIPGLARRGRLARTSADLADLGL